MLVCTTWRTVWFSKAVLRLAPNNSSMVYGPGAICAELHVATQRASSPPGPAPPAAASSTCACARLARPSAAVNATIHPLLLNMSM